VSRVFLLLLRNTRIAVPDELAGKTLLAKYVSPISRAQRQGEAEAFGLAMNYLAPAVQADPSILDNFDLNRVARDSQELFGYPANYLLPEEVVAKLRKDRAQQQQQQQAAQAAVAMAAQAAKMGAGAGNPQNNNPAAGNLPAQIP